MILLIDTVDGERWTITEDKLERDDVNDVGGITFGFLHTVPSALTGQVKQEFRNGHVTELEPLVTILAQPKAYIEFPTSVDRWTKHGKAHEWDPDPEPVIESYPCRTRLFGVHVVAITVAPDELATPS